MIRSLFALALLALASAAPAQSQDIWRHRESGVSLPRSIGDMQLNRERDASGGGEYDVILQYGGGPTAVTLYVYRSAYPNPALWFERTRLAMSTSVGAPAQGVDPRPITLGGASAPNGLREDIAVDGNRARATSVVIAQVGEWLVKARTSSLELDLAGVSERMDRLLAALRFETMPAPHPLRLPPPCGEERRMSGERLSRSAPEALASAVANGATVLAHSRGRSGLAADPAAWCRVAAGIPAQYGAIYRERSGSAWVALLGDSGLAVTALRLEEARGAGAATYVSTPGRLSVAALYEDMPDADSATVHALPVVAGEERGLADIADRAPGGNRR